MHNNTTRKTDARMLLILVIVGLFSLAGAVSAATLTIGNAQVNSIGNTATVDLILDSAPTGLGGYSVNVTMADPTKATITAVSYPSWAGTFIETSPLPCSTDCKVKALDMGEQVQSGATGVTLATLTIQGLASGTTAVTVSNINMMSDDADDDLSPVLVPGTFAVIIPPTATFTADVTSGTAPLTVTFTDTSANYPTSWAWDFGDGATSTGQNPTHVYTVAGTYTAKLTVTNTAGTSDATQVIIVTEPVPAPVADFTSDVQTGTVPLSVQFSDISSNNPTSWAWDFGDEAFMGSWKELTASAGWSARRYHSSVVLPDGSIVVMGGLGTSYKNDVWRSTDKGATWTQMTASAGWSARYGQSSVALPDGSIVVMGGYTGSYKNDVWRSTDNGATWTQMTAGAGWSARSSHRSVALPDGSIVLMGGERGSNLHDVWRSTDNGATWTQMTAGAGWSARYGHSSVVLPDGSIVVMGGDDGSEKNDVWRSTDNGATWMQVTAGAGWAGRHGHTSVALPDGSIVLMGGYAGSNTNEVWQSTDMGATWTPLANAGWSVRGGHASEILPDGSIVVLGGSSASLKNDVWRVPTTGSSAQNPSHTYTTAGTYTVKLIATNSGGSDDETKTAYIIVSAPAAPVAAFTSDVQSGTVPLTVTFTDKSTGYAITAWAWDFGDGDSTNATKQNPVHTYATAGTYAVKLTATNAGGIDDETKTAYITISAPAAPVAAFTSDVQSGTVPLTVTFTDKSTGYAITAWAWDFGDGSTSTGQNPIHAYTAVGTYTVKLTVTNAGGSDDEEKTTYITITAAPIAPVAAFTSDVQSGTVPLTVQFTDTSSNTPTLWTWDFGDATFTGIWTQMTAGAGWSARRYQSSAVLPDGSIVVMGGLPYKKDVWRSTDKGATWTQMTANAGWSARYGQSSVALPDGSIVVMGGYAGSYKNDVWRSTDNGATWTQMTASAGWSARSSHRSVVLPDGSIVLMGGERGPNLNDVWRSTDKGATWTQMTAGAGWSARYCHSSVALPDGSIVVMGGDDGSEKNDVWRSTDNGATWTQMTAGAGWAGRHGHSSEVLPDGSIVLMGGYAGSNTNEVWQSTDMGATWTQLANAEWSARGGHTSVALPDGSIVVMGGSSASLMNDVWRTTSGSSAQNPSHTFTAPGTYTVKLIVTNTAGSSEAMQIITVREEGPVTAPEFPTMAFPVIMIGAIAFIAMVARKNE